jgi:hypothetical protein
MDRQGKIDPATRREQDIGIVRAVLCDDCLQKKAQGILDVRGKFDPQIANFIVAALFAVAALIAGGFFLSSGLAAESLVADSGKNDIFTAICLLVAGALLAIAAVAVFVYRKTKGDPLLRSIRKIAAGDFGDLAALDQLLLMSVPNMAVGGPEFPDSEYVLVDGDCHVNEFRGSGHPMLRFFKDAGAHSHYMSYPLPKKFAGKHPIIDTWEQAGFSVDRKGIP